MNHGKFKQTAISSKSIYNLPHGLYTAWLWHGTTQGTFEVVKTGGYLKIPKDYNKSDPGDLGKGVYLTKSINEARRYSDSGQLIRAHVSLKNALFLDFTNNKEVCNEWYKQRGLEWGSPVHGDLKAEIALIDAVGLSDEEYHARSKDLRRRKGYDRKKAAERWRTELLKLGYDGIITKGWDLGETAVVFRPERNIVGYECWLWPDNSTRAIRIK